MTDAVAYIDAAGLVAYFTPRGGVPVAWTSASLENQNAALLIGAEWLDRTFGPRWAGVKTDAEQVRDHPREGLTDRDGNPLAFDTTQTAVRYANAEAAILHLGGQLDSIPDRATTTSVKRKTIKAEGVEKTVEYGGAAFESASLDVVFPKIEAMLSHLLTDGGGGSPIEFGIGGGGGIPFWTRGLRY